MNRQQRRQSSKQGTNLDFEKYMSSPCTITEATQISRGVAQDVVTDYEHRTRPLQIAMSLQVEILKDIVIKAGLISEQEFKERYIKEAERFNRMQKEAMEESQDEESTPDEIPDSPAMKIHTSEIEIKKA